MSFANERGDRQASSFHICHQEKKNWLNALCPLKEPSRGGVGASPTEQGISFVPELGGFEGNISLSIPGKVEVGRSGWQQC